MALYASSADALAACKADVSVQHNGEKVKLRLRILKKNKAVISAVFNPMIVIEGVDVNRDELATTAGLQWANQCRIVPKWCRTSAAGDDCPQGIMCRFIHWAKHQRTVMRKRQLDDETTSSITPSSLQPSFSFRDIQALVPPSMRCEKVGSIPVSATQIERFLAGDIGEVIAAVEVEAGRLALENPYVKFNVDRGAPWDWCLSPRPEAQQVLIELRRLCPLPKGGIATPEERDVFFQRLQHCINSISKFDSASQAVEALAASEDVRKTLEAYLRKRPKTTASGSGEADDTPDNSISLLVMPWLPIPSVLHEVTIFVANGIITRVNQRHSMKFVPSSSESESNLPGAVVKGVTPKLMLLQNYLQSDGMRKGVTCAFDAIITGANSDECTVVSVHEFNSKADRSEVFQNLERKRQQGMASAAGGTPSSDGGLDSELPHIPIFNTTTHQRFPLFTWDQLSLLK